LESRVGESAFGEVVVEDRGRRDEGDIHAPLEAPADVGCRGDAACDPQRVAPR
jgi:hypothetical protein